MNIRWAIILLCVAFVLWAGPSLAGAQVQSPAGERAIAERDYQKMRQLLVDDAFLKQPDRLARRQAVTGVRADYDTEPRLSDDAAPGVTPASSRVDIPRLIRHLEEIGANCYHYLIFHQKTDWDDFPRFVEAAEKSADLRSRGFTVWVYLAPPSESRTAQLNPASRFRASATSGRPGSASFQRSRKRVYCSLALSFRPFRSYSKASL